MLVKFIVGAIAMGIVYLYGCVGETITEKAGNLNLGIPGIMSLGALGGAIGTKIYFSMIKDAAPKLLPYVLIALLFTFVFAGLGGLIYAFLTVTLQANQNVTGLVLTTFGVGLMKFIGAKMTNNGIAYFTPASKTLRQLFVNYDKLGWFGEIFLSHGILVYLAIFFALSAAYFFKRSKTGLFLRSIGESPQTADAQGINVSLYKYLSIIVGAAIAGVGGFYYVMDKSGGTVLAEADIESFGWLAVALVIFSMWKPTIGILGSILFGALYILPTYINISNVQVKLFAILPYAVTVLVLILTSVLDAKNSQPPASLGINYFREER